MFSVNVLLFGDYPELATRCLSPIVESCLRDQFTLVRDVRIGLNAVSDRTKTVVRSLLEPLSKRIRVRLYREAHDKNVHKYPLMRRMFHGSAASEDQHYTVWFDDDSYIKDYGGNFWVTLKMLLTPAERETVFGSVYVPKYTWTVRERENISQQAWYRGIDMTSKPQFATGGFWVANTSLLRKWDYPFPALRHNGGDVLFGELCRQQKIHLRHWRDRLVAINADEKGQESRAKRRGDTTARGFDGDINDVSHHDFDLCVETLNGD